MSTKGQIAKRRRNTGESKAGSVFVGYCKCRGCSINDANPKLRTLFGARLPVRRLVWPEKRY